MTVTRKHGPRPRVAVLTTVRLYAVPAPLMMYPGGFPGFARYPTPLVLSRHCWTPTPLREDRTSVTWLRSVRQHEGDPR